VVAPQQLELAECRERGCACRMLLGGCCLEGAAWRVLLPSPTPLACTPLRALGVGSKPTAWMTCSARTTWRTRRGSPRARAASFCTPVTSGAPQALSTSRIPRTASAELGSARPCGSWTKVRGRQRVPALPSRPILQVPGTVGSGGSCPQRYMTSWAPVPMVRGAAACGAWGWRGAVDHRAIVSSHVLLREIWLEVFHENHPNASLPFVRKGEGDLRRRGAQPLCSSLQDPAQQTRALLWRSGLCFLLTVPLLVLCTGGRLPRAHAGRGLLLGLHKSQLCYCGAL